MLMALFEESKIKLSICLSVKADWIQGDLCAAQTGLTVISFVVRICGFLGCDILSATTSTITYLVY